MIWNQVLGGPDYIKIYVLCCLKAQYLALTCLGIGIETTGSADMCLMHCLMHCFAVEQGSLYLLVLQPAANARCTQAGEHKRPELLVETSEGGGMWSRSTLIGGGW